MYFNDSIAKLSISAKKDNLFTVKKNHFQFKVFYKCILYYLIFQNNTKPGISVKINNLFIVKDIISNLKPIPNTYYLTLYFIIIQLYMLMFKIKFDIKNFQEILCKTVELFLNLTHLKGIITKPGIFVKKSNLFTVKELISKLKSLPNRYVQGFNHQK